MLDSLTQIALGSTVATLCVPEHHRRKAVLIGAILGTVPDLDVFIDYGDAVSNFTQHRGFSHSLFVLIPLSFFIWVLLKKFYEPVRNEPLPWLLAVSLTLITHPLLDAHTVYGTQLFWPLTFPPVMWSTIFIIDPLYTLPLLIGVIAILIKPYKLWAVRTLATGLILSSTYLLWTWSAKIYVDHHVLTTLGNDKKIIRIFSSPTPFNSVLWRVVVLQKENYLEGYYSLLHPKQTINFNSVAINRALLKHSKTIPAVKRLDWFAQGFNKYSIVDDNLVMSDLRMGFEGNYVFNHAVAERGNPHWYEIKSKRMPSQLGIEDLSFIWKKLIEKP